MPQYELEHVGPAQYTGLQRGRTAEEAARVAGDVADGDALVVGSPEGTDAWQSVTVAGASAGRIRLYGRMRFQRD